LVGAERVFSLCAMSSIGVMHEGPLHAAIKAFLVRPRDRLEVPVGRFVIDLVRADGELVEVQTGGFSGLGKKVDALLAEHRVRIVHRSRLNGESSGSTTAARSCRSAGPRSVPQRWWRSTSSLRSRRL